MSRATAAATYARERLGHPDRDGPIAGTDIVRPPIRGRAGGGEASGTQQSGDGRGEASGTQGS